MRPAGTADRLRTLKNALIVFEEVRKNTHKLSQEITILIQIESGRATRSIPENLRTLLPGPSATASNRFAELTPTAWAAEMNRRTAATNISRVVSEMDTLAPRSTKTIPHLTELSTGSKLSNQFVETRIVAERVKNRINL
jgi:hypothetical protein